MASNLENFRNYLRSYAGKDLSAISAMFSENVTLRDWNICVHGRAAALAETETNFANAETIEIEVLQVYESPASVAGELRIVVNGSVELFVVDVLDFDANGQITAVRAYLGRGATSECPPGTGT